MLKRICNILSKGILVILALIAAVLLIPHILGHQTLAVLSGSMEPKISVGSIVVVKDAEPLDIEVGDVITYRLSGNTLVTHRVVEQDMERRQFITKGDANEAPDAAPVAYESVVGKVAMHFPLLGYLSIYMKTPLGITGICVLLMVMILLNFLPDIFSKEKGANKEKR